MLGSNLTWGRMRPGGLCGLQLRWQQSFDWCGGFDSLALPPYG
ncbi:uncharacterized protein METZ01_LOCUS199898 [marine metagenome]|uniref:Uncharacterized protein n=1 Tax=marine metagenome TaxID=408172 RepID=A0A382EAC9_9ZZZZ